MPLDTTWITQIAEEPFPYRNLQVQLLCLMMARTWLPALPLALCNTAHVPGISLQRQCDILHERDSCQALFADTDRADAKSGTNLQLWLLGSIRTEELLPMTLGRTCSHGDLSGSSR